MNKAIITLGFTALLASSGYAQIIDRNANTGVINREPTLADQGRTKMVGEDPMQINLKAVQEAFDVSEVTANVVTFNYDPNVTYKVRTRVGVRTLIRLDENETIFTYLVGNPTIFNVIQIAKDDYKDRVIPNLITVKPLYPGADSNLNIITKSGKVLNFYLRADPVDSKTVPHFTVNVTDKKNRNEELGMVMPSASPLPAIQSPTEVIQPVLEKDDRLVTKQPYTIKTEEKADYLKSTDKYAKYNFKYKAYGSSELAPAMIYDDGNFTYFDFRDRLASDRLPVIFKIVDGYDTIVNTRMEKGYLIAESLSAEGWTLKNGEKHTCIRANGPVGAKQRATKTVEVVREYEDMNN